MDYDPGELDYDPLEEAEEELVTPATDEYAENGAELDGYDEFTESVGVEEEPREATPEPDDGIGFPSSEGRHSSRTSRAESTGDSGLGSGISTDDQMRSISPDFGRIGSNSPEIPAALPPLPVLPKLCRLAYHQLPGYPRLRATYNFLRPKRHLIPEMHQLLHLCHDGTEKELMDRLQHIIQTFEYQKVVIFARRTERLIDIKVALKIQCGLDSLLIDGDADSRKVERVCNRFAQMRRRSLLCCSKVLPSTAALKGVNLIFWWNLPYTFDDFAAISGRLCSKALILVVLKQEDDWEFLHMVYEGADVVLPEIDLESSDAETAGFINGNVGAV